MFHLVFRARPGTLLFHTHVEANALWSSVSAAFPELEALCLMPNHGHLQLPHDDPGGRLGRALQGFAHARNATRGATGPVFERTPSAEPLVDRQKIERTQRYIELNPCRAHLTDDPLRWPWSSLRDAVGFAANPVRPPMPNPERHLAWLAADPEVNDEAALLPSVRFLDFGYDDVVDAVCGVFRAARGASRIRGVVRSYAIRTAIAHGVAGAVGLARSVGCDRGTIRRLSLDTPARSRRIADPVLSACVRAVGDPRFRALPEGDLRLASGPMRRFR